MAKVVVAQVVWLCSICNKTIVSSEDMSQHLQTEHGIIAYKDRHLNILTMEDRHGQDSR